MPGGLFVIDFKDNAKYIINIYMNLLKGFAYGEEEKVELQGSCGGGIPAGLNEAERLDTVEESGLEEPGAGIPTGPNEAERLDTSAV